jgi:hypothetical protein
VKFKIIAMSGTTGIWPNRPTEDEPPKPPIWLGGFGGNTFEAGLELIAQAKKLARAVSGTRRNSTAVLPSVSGQDSYTGYFQALLLSQFLERYAIAKKDPANNGWRLVLNIPKENQSFICTPQQFSLTKSHQRPNEYLWSLQLKAWKRINLFDSPFASNAELAAPQFNLLARLNAILRESRRLISAAINVLRAIRGDIEAVLELIRQVALVVKDLADLAHSVGDLKNYIAHDIGKSLSNSKQIYNNAKDEILDSFRSKSSSSASSNVFLKAAASASGTLQTEVPDNEVEDAISKKILDDIALAKIETEKAQYIIDNPVITPVDPAAVAAEATRLAEIKAFDDAIEAIGETQRTINKSTKGYSETAVITNITEDEIDFAAIFSIIDQTNINDLLIDEEIRRAIDEDMERVRALTVNDLIRYKDVILGLALDVSNSFGAGHKTYASVYNRPDPIERSEPMTVEENELCLAIFDIVNVLDSITATKTLDDRKIQNPLSYVGNLATQSDISFDDATSKFLVPVPFGLTIELVAARYLGNPDKWIELATLNHLRSPYIDEEGFKYSLLSNATGRQFNVDDSQQRLYVGQKIILSSNIIGQIIRKIASIDKINDTNYLITTDGLADLDSLQTTNNAIMQGYLPGTVNSQDQIFIPTNTPSPVDDKIRTLPAFRNDQLTRISKIDWMLTDDGDLAINGLGEFRLANGLNNLIQALKLKIRTKKGTLLRHIDFGLGIQHGISIADIEQGVLMQELTRIVVQDNRFSGVSKLEVILTGSTLTINMEVTIANNNGILPISFSV